MGLPNTSRLRVIELSVGGAVPWLCKHLTWHGAEVVRIEMKAHPDAIRSFIPSYAPEKGLQPNLSPWHTEWHSGKLHIGLNLERPQSQHLFHRLVSISDAVVTNLSPTAAARVGLTYPELKKVNPSVILLHNTAYGASGPYAKYRAWGTQVEAVAGLSFATQHPQGQPVITSYTFPDWIAGVYGLLALLGALRERSRTGKGQFIDLSMFESTVASLGDLLLEYDAYGREPAPQGNWVPDAAPHNCYPCKGEDRWCVIAVHTEQEWASFCQVLGTPSWARDPRFQTMQSRLAHAPELDALIAQWTSQRDPYEVMRVMQEAGVPAGVVQDVEDLLKDEHLKARQFFVQYEHLYKGKVLGTGLAVRLCEPDAAARRGGHAVGQDNEIVSKQLLGLAEGEYQELIAQGILEFYQERKA